LAAFFFSVVLEGALAAVGAGALPAVEAGLGAIWMVEWKGDEAARVVVRGRDWSVSEFEVERLYIDTRDFVFVWSDQLKNLDQQRRDAFVDWSQII
jgi:hypothetical protein